MNKNIVSQKTLLQRVTKNLKVLTLVGTTVFSLFISTPLVHADVVSDYITSLRGTRYPDDLNDNASVQSLINTLNGCLSRENQWQWSPTTGGPAPSTSAELAARLTNNSHPCKNNYDNVMGGTTTTPPAPAPAPAPGNPPTTPDSTTPTSPDPATSQNPPAAPAPNPSTPQQPASSGGAAVIDSRPLYSRIVPPSSRDVLTPDFARSNPSIASLVNFLFDLFVRRLLPWLVALMVLLLVWSGYLYIMAAGDSAKVKQAKDMILYSIIAMVLSLAALSIITVLNTILMAAR